jgi:hypothetical protein
MQGCHKEIKDNEGLLIRIDMAFKRKIHFFGRILVASQIMGI